jgi:alanine racemase
MVQAEHAGGLLTINLDAVAANWRLLRDRVAGACAAVCKADAYGLGVGPVVTRLAREGCRHFFVAQLDEAAALRPILDAVGSDAAIYVLNGLAPGAIADYLDRRLVPVLNSLGEVEAWSKAARTRGRRLEAVLNIDTGMARLGLPRDEAETLAADPGRLDGIAITYVMSHLACGSDRANPLNAEQLAAFRRWRARLPAAPATFANSAGIFLGADYHFDLARPGASIYGLAPLDGESNPMAQVILLQGRILQIRFVDRGMTVGYGATHRFTRPSRLATVAVGYGDGYLRSLGNAGSGYVGDVRVPVVGRVSMDLVTFDVTDAPQAATRPGATIDLLCERHGADALAAEAGTIGYEILTALGRRYHRRYIGAGISAEEAEPRR